MAVNFHQIKVLEPLPVAFRDWLVTEAVHRSSNPKTFCYFTDGRMVPHDFSGVPPDGKLLLKHRDQVLVELNLPDLKLEEAAGRTSVTLDCNDPLRVYARVDKFVKVEEGMPWIMYMKQPKSIGLAWPEERTSAYRAYVEEVDDAVAGFFEAHERLIKALALNPITWTSAKRAREEEDEEGESTACKKPKLE